MSKALQFLIYNTPQEDIKVNVVMRDETIWLTQKAMAELFDNLDAIISVGYRVNSAKATLSPVESAYLESVKGLEKR